MSEPTATNLVAPDLGTQYVKTRLEGRVLHLQIDRTPRRNAFTQDMYRGIKRAATWADEQDELDAVCITGTDKWFAAGGDMGGNAEDTEGLAQEWDPTEQFPFRHIERCSKLWIAKINGLAHAGGLVLTLHCDVTIASDQARFRAPELLRGIPDAFLSSRLAEVVGLARARYLLYTAAEITAAEAYAMGLIGAVVPHEELDAKVAEAIERIALTGPKARTAVKRDLNRRLPVADVDLFRKAITSAEMREGMTAFIQKRPPEWPRD